MGPFLLGINNYKGGAGQSEYKKISIKYMIKVSEKNIRM